MVDKTSTKLDEVRTNISFYVHPYKHTTLGTIEDIRDMPNELEYSRQFFERFYKPEHAVVMVFGDVDVDETKVLIEKYWGGWEVGEGYTPDIPQEPPREESVYEHIEWPEASTPWLSISFNAANFTVMKPDTAALDIIQNMVFSSASALYNKLVIDEQIAKDLSASYFWLKDPYLFVIEADVAVIDYVWYVRDEILKELSRLRTEMVSNHELERVKSNLKYAAAMQFVSTQAISDVLQYYVALTGSPDSINQIYALYDTITPDIVMEVANKYFTDNHLATITLAFADEDLPEPPAPVSADYNAYAGSVDAFVEASQSADVFQIDQVLLPSSSSLLVYFDIRFRVGVSDDPEGKEGLAAITAIMLSAAGSSSLTYAQIQDLLFPMAAQWSGVAAQEYTLFRGSVHLDNLDRFYDIVSDMLLDPGFREDDFTRVKTDLIRGIQDAAFSDASVQTRAFDSTVFENHPYEHFTYGTIASLDAITMEDVKDFYRTWFTTQNVIIGLAGGIYSQFESKVNSDLQKLPDGPVDKQLLAAPPRRNDIHAIIVEQEATEATTVMLGFSLPTDFMSRAHPDYAALTIALDHYGGSSFTSQLMSEIRVKRGINYGSYARLRHNGLAFQATLGAMGTTETAHFATRLAMFELDKLLTEGLTEEKYEYHLNGIVNEAPVAVAKPADVLSLAVEGQEYGFGTDYLGYFIPALQNTTADQVNNVVKKWLQADGILFVFVTANATDMYARLTNETESSMTYSSADTPADVLSADEVIKNYPLGLTPSNVEIISAAILFPGTDEGEVMVSLNETLDNDSSEFSTDDFTSGDESQMSGAGSANGASRSVAKFAFSLACGIFTLLIAA
jgi:zinc protease